jgi:hypothetical protein
MANHGEAYKSIIGELKQRIGEYGSSRLHKKEKGHSEPDGDEDADGNEYPGNPDAMTDTENVNVRQKGNECGVCGDSIDGEGNCPSCEAKE